MKIHFLEMLTGCVARLRYVFRFSTCRVGHRESVAEHSFYVAWYSMLITRWVISNTDIHVRIGDTLQRALIHDVEECRSGDFPRVFKHSDPAMKTELDRCAYTAMDHVARRLFEPDDLDIHDDSQKHESSALVSLWENSKRTEFGGGGLDHGGMIVKFADFIAVVAYMYEEVRDHNGTFLEHIGTINDYAQQFGDEQYDFIRPLVDDAMGLCKYMEHQVNPTL